MNQLSYKSMGAYVILFIVTDISLDYVLSISSRVTRISLAITLFLIAFIISKQIHIHLSSKNK